MISTIVIMLCTTVLAFGAIILQRRKAFRDIDRDDMGVQALFAAAATAKVKPAPVQKRPAGARAARAKHRAGAGLMPAHAPLAVR